MGTPDFAVPTLETLCNSDYEVIGVVTQPDKPKPKSISEMSDDELQKLINRKRLEQQYSQLSPKKVSAGKKFVDKVLLPAAQEAGKKALSSYMEKQFRAVLKVPAQNDGKKKDK